MGLEELDKLDSAWENTQPAKPGASGFSVIPEGTKVKAVISDQKPGFLGEKKTPACQVTFEVVEPAEYAPKQIWHTFWLTLKNMPYLRRDLELLGWQGKPTQLLNEADSSLIGVGAEFTTGVEQYQTKDKNTGALLFTVEDGQKIPVMREKNTVKFFDARYDYKPGEAAERDSVESEGGAAAAEAAGDVPI